MFIKRVLPLISFTLLLATYSCKKEPTQWSTNWAAPIAHGHLTINDAIPVEYTETNEGGYLSLVIDETLFEFSVDTLIDIPDNSADAKTTIDVPSFEVTPSFFTLNVFEQAYDVGDIELKRIIIESGEALSTAQSEWPGRANIFVNFPQITRAGETLQHLFEMEAGASGAPSEQSVVIDLTHYDMDLTGIDGDLVNTVEANLITSSGEETESYIVTDQDSVYLSFSFSEVIPRYAKGYFGHYYFSDTTGFSLAPMKKIIGGSIDIDSIDLNISIRNGFNLIAQSKITRIAGFNTRTDNLVDLGFPGLNTTLNIDPASGGLYDYVPSEYPLSINNTNSNMVDFVENLSDSLVIGYELEINPFGNISGGSDELFPDSKIEIHASGEFPLSFGANDLTVADTLTVEGFESSTVSPENALVELEYTNGFPIGAETEFFLYDAAGTLLDSISGNMPVVAGSYNTVSFETTPQSGKILFELSEANIQNLEATKSMVLIVSFNTDGDEPIKITPDTYFDFNLRTNLQIRISI